MKRGQERLILNGFKVLHPGQKIQIYGHTNLARNDPRTNGLKRVRSMTSSQMTQSEIWQNLISHICHTHTHTYQRAHLKNS